MTYNASGVRRACDDSSVWLGVRSGSRASPCLYHDGAFGRDSSVLKVRSFLWFLTSFEVSLLVTYSALIPLCMAFSSPSRALRGFPLVNGFLAFVTVLHLACPIGLLRVAVPWVSPFL